MRFPARRLAALLLLAISTLAAAGEARPRVALVLSGGGARGMAHIGVLKVLEQLRVPVDCVVGTSMGAIVGAAYARGLSAEALETHATDADWPRIFSSAHDRREQPYSQKDDVAERRAALELGISRRGLELPRGVAGGQGLDRYLIELAGGARPLAAFDELPLPFRSVATDLESGAMRVFADGPLWEAMRASMSVPGVFAPLEVEGRLLVDGGLVRNLPVDIGRALCGDVVIAVNLGTPPWDRTRLATAADIALQAINLTLEQNVARSLAELRPGDVLIAPELGTMSAAAFDAASPAIARGEEAAWRVRERLAALALPDAEYAAWRTALSSRLTAPAPVAVDTLRIVANRRWSDETLRDGLRQRVGEPLDEPALRADLDRLRSLGGFERIGYRLVREGNASVLAVEAHGKSWGPNYLRLGGGLKNDFEGGAAYSLFAGLDVTDLNDWRAAWRNELQIGARNRLRSEWFQPLGATSRFFVAPSLTVESYLAPLYAGTRRVRDYRIGVASVALDLGRDLGSWGQARLGIERGSSQARLAVGDEQDGLPTAQRIDLGALTATLAFDTQDRAYFPNTGSSGALRVTAAHPALGATERYDKVTFDFTRAFSSGRHAVEPALSIGGSPRRQGDLPVYDQFAMGGFQQLSGYRLGQIRADAMAFGRLLYRYRIGSLPPALGGAIHLGATVELAALDYYAAPGMRVRDHRRSFSAFVGVDSPLGPLYLAVGHAPAADRFAPASTAVYLLLGRP